MSAVGTPARRHVGGAFERSIRAGCRAAFLEQSLFQVQTRAFSRSLRKRFADEDGNFDPRQIERESDEVDVCIVGGGKDNL